MEKTRLGKTDLMVSRTGFGAIPIQRINDEESTAILRRAFESGVNFFDTARGYTTSESKIHSALGDVRKEIIIATKNGSVTGEGFEKDLATSLSELGTDYIDVYQFHNLPFVPRPGGADGVYDAMLKAKSEGKVRHIGATSHKLDIAKELVASGLIETIQFPLSSLSSDEEVRLVELSREHDVGFIAMKGMVGGLITNAKSAFAFLRQFENVVPIWGVQFLWELEEFLGYEKNPPALDDELWAVINKDREDLSGDFCRACGYCLPCPANIVIPMAARMKLLLGRMDWRLLISDWSKEETRRINDCVDCRHCIEHCPYDLDPPRLLRENLEYFEKFVTEHS